MLSNMLKLTRWTRSLTMRTPLKNNSSVTLKITPVVSLPPLLVEKNSITVLPLLVTTLMHGLSETLGDPPGETKAMSRLQEVVRTFVEFSQIPHILSFDKDLRS